MGGVAGVDSNVHLEPVAPGFVAVALHPAFVWVLTIIAIAKFLFPVAVIHRAVAYNRHEFILDSIFVARVVVAANACSGGGMGWGMGR